ncbi:ribonuclease H-like domain-containing protein [Candidatus Woesearchaeota archaeon]|nr:ribonuclease H-like domain-containing protein [Candidatus Woesearchaeota archaeon]
MHLTFFPYDFQYKVKESKVLVYLYGKDSTGKKICVVVGHQPFFYAKIADLNKVEEKLRSLKVEMDGKEGIITGFEPIEKELIGKKEIFYKIFTNFPKAVPLLSKELEHLGIKTYEKDILFIHRFLRDTGILPFSGVEIEGDFAQNEEPHFRVPLFFAKKITPLQNTPASHLKILAVDLETYAKTRVIDMQKNPILMIALSGIDEQGTLFKKVLTWKPFPCEELDYIEILADETAVLQRFRDLLIGYQPDVITGYNSDGFDLPYLSIRAEKNKVKLDLGVDGSPLFALGDARDSKESKIVGILHLDLYQFIKRIFGRNLKTDSYSLDAVAQELLGHAKHKVDLDQLHDVWDNAHLSQEKSEKLKAFCAYNIQDADLTLKLCQKLLADMITFSQVTGLPTFDVVRMSFSRLVESYIMKRAIEFAVLAPNRPTDYEMQQRMQNSYEGGFVFQPKPGFYKDIVVFDYRSLYPSIITAHNIGPESFQCMCCGEKKEKKVPQFSEYWFCGREKKFLPTILEDVLLRRAEIKKQIKQAKIATANDEQEIKMLESRSYAFKLLANSFYGYLGFSGARWYCFPCAQATTAYARNYIQGTIKKAEEAGFSVCYSDTDSCFLLLGTKKIEDAKMFMENINKELPGHMELEMEGYYSRGIFVALKHGEKDDKKDDRKGAKKKYALLREDGKLKIVGFEMVRRNWSLLAKEVQEKVLQMVLDEQVKEALQYVRQVISELKSGKIEKKKLVIRMKITRDLDKYASVGPHVAVARKMIAKGYPVNTGMIVEYIIVTGSGLVRERAALLEEVDEGKYDAEYYLTHQLVPAVTSIFSVFGITEEEIFKESRQTGLGAFG